METRNSGNLDRTVVVSHLIFVSSLLIRDVRFWDEIGTYIPMIIVRKVALHSVLDREL